MNNDLKMVIKIIITSCIDIAENKAKAFAKYYPDMKLGKYTAGDMVALFKNTVNYFRKEMNLHNGK